MRATVEKIIRKGAKTTRYLICVNGEYASVKLPNEETVYEMPKEVDFCEGDIDRNINDKWVKASDNWPKIKCKILSHLSKYKKNKLNICEDGYWTNKDGENIEYSHILPDGEIKKNLIDSSYHNSMEKTFDAEKDKIHPGFKNLNSSQAFAFNFFQPIIDENLFYDLFELACDNNSFAKRNHKTQIFRHKFEKDNVEDKTQFDFYIEKSDLNVSFEVKYTENEFGTADYESHKEKWDEIYKQKVDKLLGCNKISPEEFFENYQIWRNILFTLDENHFSCFFYPRFREGDLTTMINQILDKYPSLKERIIIFYTDDFVNKILDGDYSEKLKEHYREFKKKYLPDNLL